MSSDLIAWGVAVALGVAVVIVGLRRNLSETTRNGLPRLGGDLEQATATLGLYEGGERRRRPPSRRQRRWQAAFYLLLALANAAFAVFAANDQLLHAGTAGLWALGAALLLWRASSQRSDESAS